MSLIPKRELLVTRKSEGVYFEGEWLEGQDNNFVIKASVQGTNAQTLQALPEGYRIRETYTLYTNTELLLGDKVLINNEEFLVIKVTPYRHFKTTSHYQAVVVKFIEDGTKSNL